MQHRPGMARTLIESRDLGIHQKSQNWGQIDFSLSLYIVSGSIFTVNKGSQYSPNFGATEFYLTTGENGTGTFSRRGGSSVEIPPGTLTTGKWHKLKFSIRGYTTNATMTASIGEVGIGSICYDGISPAGGLGLSAGNDTAIIVKDLLVQDINGTTLYFNSLTSQSALEDFATGTNYYGACFDGGKRDRTVWAGDFSIFRPTIFYSTANIEAVAGSLLLFTGVQDAQGQISSSVPASLVPSEVPSHEWEGGNFYSLIYAISSANAWYEWYRYTGDNTWWPAIKRGIDYGLTAFDQETGLITVSGLACVDFDYYEGPTPGTHIAANSIVVWALRNAALISESLGDSVASGYRKTADTIESVFLPIVSPYASGFHTWAAFEAGMDDEAISLMRTVWKNQIDTDNAWYAGMTWEFINGTTGEPYRPNDSSQAHGWGGGPTWQLSHYALGVSPAAPGFSTWSFAPRTVNLTFANGRVPTPWGTITAAWEDTRSRFEMRITAPTGTNGTILIPGAANKTIIINGVGVNANEGTTLPLGVTWTGIDGSAYRVNVTSVTDAFTISAS
ncbi:Serine protease pic autotransporter [Rhizoctonia solani]|uniref:Serine protease pic autotransporter n=1 Tax=Rhizoctonia solani TaxID=456999 RepID=A0A0K6FWF1_9AGAM|nr:Serine protease pic autotransporter [Rhizoctonia solani]